MKIRHLAIVCTMGLVGAGPALAGYGEGTMGADLVALQQQPSITTVKATAVYGPGEGSNQSVYDALVPERSVTEPASGVAGPAGVVLDDVRYDNPEETIYERITREYH